MIIKRVDLLSAGRVMGCLYGMIGLLVGGVFSLISLAGFAADNARAGAGDPMILVFGVGAVIALPIFYGVMGFIGGLITAVIYNIAASIVGGIKVEVE